MATLANKYTLASTMAGVDGTGKMIELAENISLQNEVTGSIPWFPSTEPLSNLSGRVTKRSTITARRANEGMTGLLTGKEQIRDTMIYFNNPIEPDKAVLTPLTDPGAFYNQEIELLGGAYGEASANGLFNGDSNNDPGREVDGLAKRTASLPASATDTTDPFYTVVDGGGSGSTNASVYVLGLGKAGVHFIYPKSSTGGLKVTRHGPQKVYPTDGSNKFYWTPDSVELEQHWGLVATNRRAVGRLCNVDVTTLKFDAATGTNLQDKLIYLLSRVELAGLTPVICANNEVRTYFHAQAANKGNARIRYGIDDAGVSNYMLDDVPILRCDSIGSAEARIV